MASNNPVSYIDLGIPSVAEFWQQVVVPSVRKYHSEPGVITGFSAGLHLWHLHDWVWHEDNPGTNSRGQDYEYFRNAVLAACPEVGWLRDLADASKHHGLGRKVLVSGAEPRTVQVGSMMLMGVGGTRTVYSVVLLDGSIHDLRGVIDAAVTYWISSLTPRALEVP